MRDYNLYLNYPDGTNASNAWGFNPWANTPVNDAGSSDGGHTEIDAEQIDGTSSPDCRGYTLDLTTSFGEGADMTLKLWLGEIQYTPAEPPAP